MAINACWSDVGVYGSGNCPKLNEFIHCRNCPVYASVGARLLNRPLPPDYEREWARYFASPRALSEASVSSAVLFRIRDEWLALPTHTFVEVAERRPIHSLPHRRQGIVLGLANLRGELLLCVSLGHFLGLKSLPPYDALRNSYNRLLAASWEGHRFGFPVDEVHGTFRFCPEALEPLPSTVAKSSPAYTQGTLRCQQRAAGFLDAERLFPALNRNLA